MSDGTDELRVLDPATFAERRRIKVTAAGAPLRDLNELEYVKGEIFANVWHDRLRRADRARRPARSPATSICAAC